MSRWKEFRREPVAEEWTRKQKRGYRVRSLLWFWECHQFKSSGTLSTAEGGDAEKLVLSPQAAAYSGIETPAGISGLGVQGRVRRGMAFHIFWSLAGAGWGTCPGSGLQGMALVPVASLHGAPGGLIKAYQPSHRSHNRLSRYVIGLPSGSNAAT